MDLEDLKKWLERIERKLDQAIQDAARDRVEIGKNKGHITDIRHRLEKIEQVKPGCDKRFRDLERKTNGMSGKIAGIVAAISALASLGTLFFVMFKVMHM